MCEVPINGIGDLSTYRSAKDTKWNGKYKCDEGAFLIVVDGTKWKACRTPYNLRNGVGL